MKINLVKVILIIFVAILLSNCSNPPQLCANSSKEAFEMFKLYVKNKDFDKAKILLTNDSKTDVFEKYTDTIFTVLNNPTLEFIPEEKDGAFGIKKNGNTDLFYTYLKEDNKIFSIIGILFRENINCFEIINIGKVTTSKIKNKEEYFDKTKILKSKINKSELPLKPTILEPEASIEEQQIYNKAYDIWHNDKPQEAIKLLKNFIRAYPKSSLADDAQRMIGKSFGNLKNYNQAITEYKKVKLNYPNSNRASITLYDMAHLYFFSLNDFEKAKYYYQEFVNSATKENLKWRDIAIESIQECTEKMKEFENIEKESSSNSNSTIKSSYQGPPMFVLTELNGRKLEEKAYFTIKYDNTFELKTGDGTIFKYTPTQHVGSDPLCNIVATDNRGRNTAICIKKLSGMNVMIMLENDEMISNFKGYKR